MSPRIIIKKVACYFSTYFFWSTGSRFSTPKKQVEKMMTCILKNKPMVNGFGHFSNYIMQLGLAFSVVAFPF